MLEKDTNKTQAQLVDELVKLRRYANEQAALHTISSMTATSLDTDEVLSNALEIVLPILDADMGWVCVPGLTMGAPSHIASWSGVPESLLKAEATLPLKACPARVSMLMGTESQLITSCLRLSPQVMENANIHGHVGIPLSAGDEILGFLHAAWRSPRRYDKNEQSFLLTIGRQIGMALRNAQLYQAARQGNRLRVLNDLNRDLATTLDTEAMMCITLRWVADVFKVPRGALVLCNPKTEGTAGRILTLTDNRLEFLPADYGTEHWHSYVQWLKSNQQTTPLLIDELGQSIRVVPRGPVNYNPGSLVVPVWNERKLVAMLVLESREEDSTFRPEDRMLAQIAAGHTGQAIRNAWLYRDSQNQAQRLATLNSIGEAIVSSLEPDVVLRRILELACEALDATEGSILLKESGSENLVFVHSLADEASGLIGTHLDPGQGIAGWVVQNDQAGNVSDVRGDKRFFKGVDDLSDFETYSLLCVPLRHQGEIIGVVEIVNKRTGTFTEDDLGLLESIASIAAIALQNAVMYDELKVLLRERERAQTQQIHNEKMAALGRLAASFAHEINNPIQAVLGCLLLAEEELADRRRQEKLDRYLEVARSEIERIANLVLRMREFYRPASREMQLVDLRLLLESVLALTGKQLQHSKVVVEHDWPETLPLIETNPDHLRQVFLNLVLNGMDAMPAEGGTLRVSITLDRMAVGDDQQPKPAVRIDFNDTGEGMAPERLSRVFEPFFTTKKHGAGLGLYVSYGIITSHNGQMTVTSEAGEGSTFSVLLPVEQPQEQSL